MNYCIREILTCICNAIEWLVIKDPTPDAYLGRIGLAAPVRQHIVHLQDATETIWVPPPLLRRMRYELCIKPETWRRIQAAIEADGYYTIARHYGVDEHEALSTAEESFHEILAMTDEDRDRRRDEAV